MIMKIRDKESTGGEGNPYFRRHPGRLKIGKYFFARTEAGKEEKEETQSVGEPSGKSEKTNARRTTGGSIPSLNWKKKGGWGFMTADNWPAWNQETFFLRRSGAAKKNYRNPVSGGKTFA